MTCIIGVVCEDGIVIVGDKKVKAGEMVHYQEKIVKVKGYDNFVVAAAGLTDVRDKFVNDIENLPSLIKEGIIKEDPSRGYIGLTEDIASRLREIYSERYEALGVDYATKALAALVCYKPKRSKPLLHLVDSVGVSKTVNDWEVIGSGAPYAYLFLRASYSEDAFMNGIAGIASFIILAIDQYEIDESVGPDPDGFVQVWKFPKGAEPYEAKGKELEGIMKEAEDRLKKFTNFLVLGRTRL